MAEQVPDASGSEECARAEETLMLVSSELGSFKAEINMTAVNEQVRRVLQYVIAHNSDLLANRNVDQLVLAAVYGVCKIHATDVTFKDLVQAYKTLPAVSPSTWLSVPLAKPGSLGNIIAFYNDVFVPRCKDYLHGMKDGASIIATAPGAGGAGGAGAGEPADRAAGDGAGAGGKAATLTGSPNGFRAVKRPRVAGAPGALGDGKGGAPAGGAPGAGGGPAGEEEGGGSPSGGGGDGRMAPPLSPTRRPATHLPRSPYAEYPASPFKRPAASPLRLAAASPRRPAVPPSPLHAVTQGAAGGAEHHRSPQRVPSKYGQVTLSPARPAAKSPLREAHTPRTSFLHSFGTLGALSPVPRFDRINEVLKSPAGAAGGAAGSGGGGAGQRSPAPRRMSTKPLDFTKRRPGPAVFGGGGGGGIGGGCGPHGGSGMGAGTPAVADAQAGNSALLALANASGYRASSPARPAERAPAAGAPVPDSHRMQDLAVASVLLSADDAH